jgi:hypothetical protein
MHGLFRILGLILALYVVRSYVLGQVYARSGAWGREFARSTDPWGYWSAICSYSLLSLGLLFLF